MEKGLIRHFSYGVAFSLLIVLVLLVVGAMYLTNEVGEEGILGHRDHKKQQVMEIQGNWLGMKVTTLDSATARRLGMPPSIQGVLAVDVDGRRAREAGMKEGDVIVAVNGKDIRDLTDLYDASRKLDAESAIQMDILRWGQAITLVLPPVYAAAPPLGGPPQAGQGNQPAPMTARQQNIGAAQPAGLVPQSRGPLFHCPTHNQVWPQNAVHPHYRCPVGNCPLNRIQ